MKRLTLIRHAKSNWGDPSLDDFQRPLNDRGLRNAPFMGQVLRERGFSPDLIVASDALRAITTAELIARAIGYPEERIRKEPAIYEASPATLIALVHALPADTTHVVIVGHNPGLHFLACALLKTPLDRLVTCGIVDIEFSADSWGAVNQRNGEMKDYLFPRQFTPDRKG